MARTIVNPTKRQIKDNLRHLIKVAQDARRSLDKDDLQTMFSLMGELLDVALGIQKLIGMREQALKDAADRPMKAKMDKVQKLQARLDKAQADLLAAKRAIENGEDA